MIQDWRDVLPAQSVCLTVPVVMPAEYDEPQALRQREQARRMLRTEPEQDTQQASR
jgi:hypothetical protein